MSYLFLYVAGAVITGILFRVFGVTAMRRHHEQEYTYIEFDEGMALFLTAMTMALWPLVWAVGVVALPLLWLFGRTVKIGDAIAARREKG